MNYKFCLLAIACVSLLASCSKTSQSKSNEIVIDDGYKTTAKNEIVIDDRTFDDRQETASTSETGSRKATKIIAADHSEIDTSYDGFGNKTDTRCFNNDLRVQCVMLRTAADGQKQVFVYGRAGEVKDLPEDMVGKAMTAPADEIANSAGIYQSYHQSMTIARNIEPINNAPLQPMPSYKFPVQNRQVEPIPAEETKPVADTTNAKPPETNDNSSAKPPDKEQ